MGWGGGAGEVARAVCGDAEEELERVVGKEICVAGEAGGDLAGWGAAAGGEFAGGFDREVAQDRAARDGEGERVGGDALGRVAGGEADGEQRRWDVVARAVDVGRVGIGEG